MRIYDAADYGWQGSSDDGDGYSLSLNHSIPFNREGMWPPSQEANAWAISDDAAYYNQGLDQYLSGQQPDQYWSQNYAPELADSSYGPSSAGYSGYNSSYNTSFTPSTENPYRNTIENNDPILRAMFRGFLTQPVDPNDMLGATNNWYQNYIGLPQDQFVNREYRPFVANAIRDQYLADNGYGQEFADYARTYPLHIMPSGNGNVGGGYFNSGEGEQGGVSMFNFDPSVLAHEYTHMNDFRTGQDLSGYQSILSNLRNDTGYPRAREIATGEADWPQDHQTDLEAGAMLFGNMYGFGGYNALPPYAQAPFASMYSGPPFQYAGNPFASLVPSMPPPPRREYPPVWNR